MLQGISGREKIATAVSSLVVAALSLMIMLDISVSANYSDFIVGFIAWSDSSKFSDLISGPVFVFILFISLVALSILFKKSNRLFGESYSDDLSNQIIWWSLPSIAAIAGLILANVLDVRILVISTAGIIFLAVAAAANLSKGVNVRSQALGIFAFSIVLTGLIPLELAVLLGRAPISLVGELQVSRYANASVALIASGLIAGLIYAVRAPSAIPGSLPRLIVFAQLGLPAFFLTLYPAILLQPDGALTKYETTVWLKILVVGLVLWGVVDVVLRYRKYAATTDWSKLFSPVALFALLVALKYGNTVAPHISPHDYHFGESLIGWWSYLQGTIPYVGYVPPHGLIDDDLRGYMASVFYDGSAGSIADASRLASALLAFTAFISLYLFSGSLGLAFVSTLAMGGPLSWFFLASILCLWFSRFLRENPSRWLSAWVATAPVVILSVPAQGLLVLAASGPMVRHFAWRLARHPKEMEWASFALSLTVLLVLGLLTPLVPMLVGAVRYVFENGPINQVAYGIPWDLSWKVVGAKAGLIFEAIRMSWMAVLIVCLYIIYVAKKNDRRDSEFFAAIVVIFIIILMIPYSMGRIDPGHPSRSGFIAVFAWAILLPLISWRFVRRRNRPLLILVVASMSATVNLTHLSFSGLVAAASSAIATASLRDGQSAGLAKIGKAHVDDSHWDRLSRLRAVLSAELPPGDAYLDLTSRSAQYFYLDRLPVVAITAPYNMISPAQQSRALRRLDENLPKIALLEGDNIINDGGGLALRTPLLYRFVVERYIPRYKSGFIIGYSKASIGNDDPTSIGNDDPTKIRLAVRNITDDNWDRGIHRSESALVVDDPFALSMIKAGDRITLETGEVRTVEKVEEDGNAIWLEGQVLDPDDIGYPSEFTLVAAPQVVRDYRAALFQRAFSQADFQKIPMAWGKSVETLEERMTLVKDLGGIEPGLTDLLVENELYRVNGVDPQLTYDLSAVGLSGADAGLLRFEFSCVGKTADPRIQLFWWGDGQAGPAEASSVRFTAHSGTLIVPVEASARWLTLDHIKGIRIDLDNPSVCTAFDIEDLGLYQRRVLDKLA